MSRDAAAAEASPWRPLPAATVGHLAHDLRGSIHVIRGHAELLRAEAVNEEARESAGYILAASNRLGGLCEDVIDFLRMPAVASGDMVALALHEMRKSLMPVAADRGAGLRIVEPVGGGAAVLVHSSVRRVVSHVLEHVVRTAAGDVTIGASIRGAGDMLLIAVSPAALGIGDGEDGIIAVAAELLAAHGGQLSVDGCRLELLFPIVT